MQPSVLLVECADRPGLVHGITGVLFRSGANVVGNHEFVDRTSGRFFMRTEFDGEMARAGLTAEFSSLLPEGAVVRLSRLEPKRVVVLASREHHCLGDILIRHAFGDINARVLAVISNHAALESLVGKFDVPFFFVENAGLTREAHEAALVGILDRYEPDYLVLAKFRFKVPMHDFINLQFFHLPSVKRAVQHQGTGCPRR